MDATPPSMLLSMSFMASGISGEMPPGAMSIILPTRSGLSSAKRRAYAEPMENAIMWADCTPIASMNRPSVMACSSTV